MEGQRTIPISLSLSSDELESRSEKEFSTVTLELNLGCSDELLEGDRLVLDTSDGIQYIGIVVYLDPLSDSVLLEMV